MADIKNQILKLALNYCEGEKADTPEEMLFGLVKLCSLSDRALTFLMQDEGIKNTDEVRKEVEEIRTTLEGKKLDTELMKEGLEKLLPLMGQSSRNTGDFSKSVSVYDDNTSVDKMIDDILSAMDPEAVKVFTVGKKLKDVNEYGNNLRDKVESIDKLDAKDEKADKGTEKAEKPDKTEKVEKTGEKEEKTEETAEETEETEFFSEKFTTYIESLKKIIPVFKKAGKEELLWKQGLIVSIDDGYGLSTFAKEIERIYKSNGLIGGDSGKKGIVKEEKVVFDEPEQYSDTSIFGLEKDLEKIGDISDTKKLYKIYIIDLSPVCGQMNDPKVRGLLRTIEHNCAPALVIFRLPYLERNVVARIEASITDIVSAECMIVPPVSIARMTEYMNKRAAMYGYSFDKGCDEYLEQAIVTEKNDGRFYGFRTLNKIVDTVVYRALRDSLTKKKASAKITAAVLKDYINIGQLYSDYKQTLAGLIGVDEIVEQIDRVINQVKVSQQLYEKGNEVERPSIHMMFRGNPGTGKTTMARIVAAKMKEAGILKKGSFFEIKGRDLCGRYVGETTPKTSKICRDAYGSVLFIDEAYELYTGASSYGGDYGKEALAALVAEMENHRDDMCVIFAGYTDEMDTMVKGNPGLKSRIPIVIDFPNYTKQQLEEIFFKMMEGKFEYEPALKKRVHEFFDSLGDDLLESKEFSNARFVRNLFESVWGEAAVRFDLNEDDKLVISESDFNTAAGKADLKSMVEKKMGPIGFVV